MDLDWFLVATEACGSEAPNLGYFLEVWGYIRGVGVGNKSRGSMRNPRGRGRAQGVGSAPSCWPRDSSGPSPMLHELLLVQK